MSAVSDTLRLFDNLPYCRMLRALRKGPMSSKCVAVELEISLKHARRYTDLALSCRDIHIVTWGKGARGPWYPIFAHGDGPDTPSPPTIRLEAHRQRLEQQRKEVSDWLAERRQKRSSGPTNFKQKGVVQSC